MNGTNIKLSINSGTETVVRQLCSRIAEDHNIRQYQPEERREEGEYVRLINSWLVRALWEGIPEAPEVLFLGTLRL